MISCFHRKIYSIIIKEKEDTEMISYVRGELAAIEEQKAVIDVGGVGYGVYMPQQAMTLLPAVGSTVKLYTYLNVK